MFLDGEAIFNTLFVRQHPSEGGRAEDVCQQTQGVQRLVEGWTGFTGRQNVFRGR